MTYCTCPQPSTSSDPRKDPTFCAKCSHPKHPDWDQTDENFHEFWMRIVSSYQGFVRKDYKVPGVQQTLWLQSQWREKVGRKIFGYAYLSPERDNRKEAREELADCMVYLYGEVLRLRREGYEVEWDEVLEIAHGVIDVYGRFDDLRKKYRGVPADSREPEPFDGDLSPAAATGAKMNQYENAPASG